MELLAAGPLPLVIPVREKVDEDEYVVVEKPAIPGIVQCARWRRRRVVGGNPELT